MSNYGPGIIARTNSYRIDPKSIVRRAGWNPRFDFGEIEELAKSIAQNGMLQPIRVRRHGKDKFELIDGDRRLTAVEFLLKKGTVFDDGILAIIEDKSATDVENMILMFESNSGKPFLPLEAAKAYHMLMETGLSVKQVAKMLGKSEQHVKFTVALMEADVSVIEALEKGEINSMTARTIAKSNNKDQQKQLVVRARSAGKSRASQQELKQELKESTRKRTVLKVESKIMPEAGMKQFLESTERVFLDRLKQAGIKDLLALSAISRQDDTHTLAYEFGIVQAMKHVLGLPSGLKGGIK